MLICYCFDLFENFRFVCFRELVLTCEKLMLFEYINKITKHLELQMCTYIPCFSKVVNALVALYILYTFPYQQVFSRILLSAFILLNSNS